MRWTSIAAIFILFWTISLFVVLPWGVRTTEEEGEKPLSGHAESAPHVFRIKRVALWTTIVATVLCTAYYLNYVNGWITVENLDWLN